MKNQKKKSSKKSGNPKVQKDPSLFAYREGQKIEIEADIFLGMATFANQVYMQERDIVYESKETFEKTLDTGKEVITDLGLQALRWLELVTGIHLDNADKGIAVHRDVLMKENKPKFDLEKVEKEK